MLKSLSKNSTMTFLGLGDSAELDFGPISVTIPNINKMYMYQQVKKIWDAMQYSTVADQHGLKGT